MTEGFPGDSRSLRLLDLHAGDAPTAVEPSPVVAADGLGGRAVTWLCATLVEGLMHCACAQQVVHPDLLDCIEDHRMRRRAPRAEGQA